ncbi:hypothetical protein IHQ71_00385 [Rhizobium sp. TH2]|uniref:hypothetical protein n=1 Tax=Rhizobium sp. TH2 TaxID=2775403 RepID=UPI00215765F4|nr:hypothetical protein [Rhizobium sp. TH2]UVC09131.1 hypothetical protein IHQ71_00385 [Rhizobium sp. TH2]
MIAKEVGIRQKIAHCRAIIAAMKIKEGIDDVGFFNDRGWRVGFEDIKTQL